MPEAQLKGSAYLSTLAYIETHFGGIAKHKVLARLTPEDRTMYGGVMLPIRWYPLDPFPRLLRAMEVELGRALPQLRVATVADAGHLMMLEAPAAFAAWVHAVAAEPRPHDDAFASSQA